MIAILNITLALIAAGVVVALFEAATPIGYQDESGFPLDSEKTGTVDEVRSENP